jgi:hypothetical protein
MQNLQRLLRFENLGIDGPWVMITLEEGEQNSPTEYDRGNTNFAILPSSKRFFLYNCKFIQELKFFKIAQLFFWVSFSGERYFDVIMYSLIFFLVSQVGSYKYKLLTEGVVDYALVTISSKAKDDQTLPFRTKCWASSDGFEDFDASNTKLAVFAQVEQGNRPVLNAKVE